MALIQSGIFCAGLVLLIGGAWVLVSGGTRGAAALGVPPVVAGLTVVAFGTSAPELFVSLAGALRGSTGLVLGNVIGSNVANVGLILALAAVLRPVVVERGLATREVPIMLGTSVLLAVMAWDGELDRGNAAVLSVLFVAFMAWTLYNRDRGATVGDVKLPDVDPASRGRELAKGLGLVLIGIVGLAAGGQLIVMSAVRLAGAMGVSETIIGLTMVAIGTSLPELATTVIAALRDQDDLALGNIVGSNLFNILGVAAPVGLVRPLLVEVPQVPVAWLPGDPTPVQVQLVGMLLITSLVFFMINVGRTRVDRTQGIGLLVAYALIMFIWMHRA